MELYEKKCIAKSTQFVYIILKILMPCTIWIEPDNTTLEITRNFLNLSLYLVILLGYIIIMFRKDMVLKL